MPDIDGLTPPPVPQPRPAPIPRAPDLQSVSQGIAGVLQTENASLGRDVSLLLRGQPNFHGFSGADPGGLGAIQSRTEQTGFEAFGDNTLKKIANYLDEKFFHFFASSADQATVDKVRNLQKQFFENHGRDLQAMDDAANSVMAKMGELGRFLNGQPTSRGQFSGHLPDNDITGIMQKKSALGTGLAPQVDDALAAAKDPDDRAKLQGMKDDLQSWLKDRDDRVKKEWPQVSSLQGCVDTMNTEISRQRAGLLKAADDNFALRNKQRPYLVSPTDTSPGESNLMTPALAQYIASMRNSLLQGRTQFNVLLSAWATR